LDHVAASTVYGIILLPGMTKIQLSSSVFFGHPLLARWDEMD